MGDCQFEESSRQVTRGIFNTCPECRGNTVLIGVIMHTDEIHNVMTTKCMGTCGAEWKITFKIEEG